MPKNKYNPSGLIHVAIPAIMNAQYIIFSFLFKNNNIVTIKVRMNSGSALPLNEFWIILGSAANSKTPNKLYLLVKNFFIKKNKGNMVKLDILIVNNF